MSGVPWDVQYIDLWPDAHGESCFSKFNRSITATYVDRTTGWHHVAVTWTAAGDGLTKIYRDGLLMATVGVTPPKQKMLRVWHSARATLLFWLLFLC